MTLEELEELEFKPELELSTRDGNAFAIIASAKRAGREAGLNKVGQSALVTEMMSGNYDDLLRTCVKYFDVY